MLGFFRSGLEIVLMAWMFLFRLLGSVSVNQSVSVG
jgi:hypothetical protein